MVHPQHLDVRAIRKGILRVTLECGRQICLLYLTKVFSTRFYDNTNNFLQINWIHRWYCNKNYHSGPVETREWEQWSATSHFSKPYPLLQQCRTQDTPFRGSRVLSLRRGYCQSILSPSDRLRLKFICLFTYLGSSVSSIEKKKHRHTANEGMDSYR